jgi:hypothetical protein
MQSAADTAVVMCFDVTNNNQFFLGFKKLIISSAKKSIATFLLKMILTVFFAVALIAVCVA